LERQGLASEFNKLKKWVIAVSNKGPMTVFLLWHEHETVTESDLKLIGVYQSYDEARAALARVSDKSGFRNTPDGFQISEYEVGKDHWTEGYISWAEAMKPPDE
jgi:hypothetical protein